MSGDDMILDDSDEADPNTSAEPDPERITVPQQQGKHDSSQVAESRGSGAEHGPVQNQDCVLVIDDVNSSLRSELVLILRAAGFEVSEAGDLSAAIQMIVEKPVRVLLHNWRSINGADAIKMHRKLAGNHEYDSVVRVVMVDNASPQFMALSYDLGVDRIFDSGVSVAEVPEKIRETCRSKDEDLEFIEILGGVTSTECYDAQQLDARVVEAYKAHPGSARVQLEYGAYLVRCGQWDDAEELAAALVESHPQDARCMNLLARVYMKQSRFSRAVEVLRHADMVSPDNPDRLVLIGDALFEKGDVGEAKESYEQALGIDPETPGAQPGLGKSLLSLGDYDTALACFRKCLSEDETASFFNNAAVIAIKTHKIEEGLQLYHIALKSLQTDKFAHVILFNIALAFYRAGDSGQAAEALKASLQYKPDYDKAQRLLETILMRAG